MHSLIQDGYVMNSPHGHLIKHILCSEQVEGVSRDRASPELARSFAETQSVCAFASISDGTTHDL